ncbi:MAG: diacylglycerol kinase family lipid kinase, partial [Actinomycetota bacterium]|nr:diacylglycerol kinase family lipid kinase [Actinomycetota bacterium]
DGTVSAVAAALAGTSTPMLVLPAGTLNHFARDLGVPLDPAEAALLVRDGARRQVDVAEVNGRVFVNNSSIGAYPIAVALRERLQDNGARGKWRAMARDRLRHPARLARRRDRASGDTLALPLAPRRSRRDRPAAGPVAFCVGPRAAHRKARLRNRVITSGC